MVSESRQQRDVDAALEDYYAGGLTAETYVERTFALMSRLLRFSIGSHGVRDVVSGELTAHFDSAPPGLEGAFAAFGRLMDDYPAFRFDPNANEGKPFSARDFYSRPAFQDLAIHQDVYRPMRLTDHCFVHVPAGPRSVVFVGLLRDGRAFERGEKRLLGRLQPHLVKARKLAFEQTRAEGIPTSPEHFARAGFSPRECDVLYWMTRGRSNEEIAALLGLRGDAMNRHLEGAYARLGVDHRVAATIAALKLAREIHAESQLVREGSGALVASTR